MLNKKNEKSMHAGGIFCMFAKKEIIVKNFI